MTARRLFTNLARYGNTSSASVPMALAEAIDEGRAPCTACRFCLPCAHGVNIPRVFETCNEARIYGDEEAARGSYAWLDEAQRADACVECGDCPDKCPQGIEIPDWLARARELLHRERSNWREDFGKSLTPR